MSVVDDQHGAQSVLGAQTRDLGADPPFSPRGPPARSLKERYVARAGRGSVCSAYPLSGLIKAVERFDLGRGLAFNTYALWWVRHAISRARADLENTIRIPVHAQESAAHEATKQAAQAIRAVSSLRVKAGGPDGNATFGDLTADADALDRFGAHESEQIACWCCLSRNLTA